MEIIIRGRQIISYSYIFDGSIRVEKTQYFVIFVCLFINLSNLDEKRSIFFYFSGSPFSIRNLKPLRTTEESVVNLMLAFPPFI